MNFIQALIDLEKDENVHLGRILTLINEFSRDGTKEIKGITKLAKLDFLLRYPVYLEKALATLSKTLSKGEVKDYERTSVESKMVRYKYGPWDFRYRRFLNILAGRGLISFHVEGAAIMIGITNKGKLVADELIKEDIHKDLAERARVLRINFDVKGTTLKNFIYHTFPEIANLNYGQSIHYEN